MAFSTAVSDFESGCCLARCRVYVTICCCMRFCCWGLTNEARGVAGGGE